MLLFLKLVDAILTPPEPTTHHSSIKLLILLPLQYETPCTSRYQRKYMVQLNKQKR